MSEHVWLGIIQGIAEWLPVSSEGALVLAWPWVRGPGTAFPDMIRYALFLHLGTALAVAIYFRGEWKRLLRGLFRFREAPKFTRQVLVFLGLSTAISGALGLFVLRIATSLASHVTAGAKGLTLLIGILLLLTAALQVKAGGRGLRTLSQLRLSDGIWLGIAQGLAVLPGLSRSGMTVSFLMLRGIQDTVALRLSFLMSLPIVLLGNLFWRPTGELFPGGWVAMAVACAVGMATMHGLIRLAQRVPFSLFVGGFGLLVLASIFL
jgi:undecaprenyl-diphosphatase